jgi:hypothetical protein
VIRDPASDKTTGYSTTSTFAGRGGSGRYGYGGGDNPEGKWCYESGRGIVGDLQESMTGLCSAGAGDDVCYVYFGPGGVSRSGCVSNATAMAETVSMTEMSVIENGTLLVDWMTSSSSSAGPMRCWQMLSERVCIVAAGTIPRNLFSSEFIAPATM